MGTTSSRMRTKRRRTGQSSSRSGAAREPPPLQLLPDDIEKENAAVLNKLPREMWEEIVGWIDGEAFFPFALTCRYFRDLRQDVEALKQGRPSRRCPCLAYKWSSYAELRSTLQSYTYIDTHDFDDAMYDATIDNDFPFDDISLVSTDYVKWLFGEARSTYCREAALAAPPRYPMRERWDAAEGERRVMELAAINGDLDLIKWLRSQDPPCEWNKKACSAAAWGNHWDLLRLLVSMGCPIEKEGMFGVVALDPDHLPDSWDGKFEILKWLQREQGCVFFEPRRYVDDEAYHHISEVAWAAVKNDDMECLEWVLDQGVTWGEIVYGPNENRRFHEDSVLDLLRDKYSIRYNLDVCYEAARIGRLKILQYAVEDGCPWIPAVCLEAARKNKHDHVVKWLNDGGRNVGHLTTSPLSLSSYSISSSSDLDDSESESDSLSE